MNEKSFDAILNELCSRNPFQLFSVELKTGRQFEVDHPKGLAFRDGFAVFIGPDTKIERFDFHNVNRIFESAAGKTESL